MNHRSLDRSRLLGACLLLISCYMGIFAVNYASAQKIPVRVVQVNERDLSSSLSAMGTMMYLAKADVSSEIDGVLSEVKVEEGDRVQKGQIIAMIDKALLKAQLRQAEAGVEMAEIDLAKNENELRKAASKLEAARIAREKLEGIFVRFQKLSDLGVTSEVEMDRAEIAYENSVAAYNAADEDYRALQTKSTQGRIESKTRLVKARAELEMMLVRLEKCTIRAPISGIVASKRKWTGESTRLGDSVIVTIFQTDEMFAEVDVNEKNAGAVKVGQEAEVRVDAVADMPFNGKVAMIGPVIDLASRTVKVRVKVANEEQVLKTGMFVRANIALQSLKNVIAVPEEAIVAVGGGQQKVFVVFDGVAFLRDVQTGSVIDGWVELKKGVRAGERVVVEGQRGLKDLAAVEAMEATRP